MRVLKTKREAIDEGLGYLLSEPEEELLYAYGGFFFMVENKEDLLKIPTTKPEVIDTLPDGTLWLFFVTNDGGGPTYFIREKGLQECFLEN